MGVAAVAKSRRQSCSPKPLSRMGVKYESAARIAAIIQSGSNDLANSTFLSSCSIASTSGPSSESRNSAPARARLSSRNIGCLRQSDRRPSAGPLVRSTRNVATARVSSGIGRSPNQPVLVRFTRSEPRSLPFRNVKRHWTCRRRGQSTIKLGDSSQPITASFSIGGLTHAPRHSQASDVAPLGPGGDGRGVSGRNANPTRSRPQPGPCARAPVRRRVRASEGRPGTGLGRRTCERGRRATHRSPKRPGRSGSRESRRDARCCSKPIPPTNARIAKAALTLRLNDRDHRARTAAGIALADLNGDPKLVIPALAEALRDDDAGVRREATRCLDYFTPYHASARSEILTALQDPDPQVRIMALNVLRSAVLKARSWRSSPIGLVRELEGQIASATADADVKVQTAAAAALDSLGIAPARQEAMPKDERHSVR